MSRGRAHRKHLPTVSRNTLAWNRWAPARCGVARRRRHSVPLRSLLLRRSPMRHFKSRHHARGAHPVCAAFAHAGLQARWSSSKARSAPTRSPASAAPTRSTSCAASTPAAAPGCCAGSMPPISNERPHLRARLGPAAGQRRRDRHPRSGDAGRRHAGLRPGQRHAPACSARRPRALDAAGNFRIDSVLTQDGVNPAVLPPTCDNPALLIRSVGANGAPGAWFAAGIPDVDDHD